MNNTPIFTLDARDNVMLEVTRDYLKVSPERMRSDLQDMHSKLIKILAKKGVPYNELRGALVPSTDKKEVGFLFDSEQISSGMYGAEIFDKLVPLLDRRTSHSILCGDLIHKNQDRLYALLQESLQLVKPFTFVHGTSLHCVYLNNLTQNSFETIVAGLEPFPAFVGFIPATYLSPMRTFLSFTLVRGMLKHKSIVIQGHEDDVPNEKNFNMSGYPFEEHDYKCVSLQSMFYDLFLAYKIERPVIPGFEVDTEFSLNAVSDTVVPLSQLKVIIEESKLKYLQENKAGSLEMAGISTLDANTLAGLIKSKISASYIYNMLHIKEYNTTKFNLMLELGTGNPVKLLAALEYRPQDSTLRLITLF